MLLYTIINVLKQNIAFYSINNDNNKVKFRFDLWYSFYTVLDSEISEYIYIYLFYSDVYFIYLYFFFSGNILSGNNTDQKMTSSHSIFQQFDLDVGISRGSNFYLIEKLNVFFGLLL